MQEEGQEGICEPSFSISQHRAMKDNWFIPQGWCMGSFQCKERHFLS